MIVVTEATGHLGRAIIRRLARRIPAARIGTGVRDPGKAGRTRRSPPFSMMAVARTKPATSRRCRSSSR